MENLPEYTAAAGHGSRSATDRDGAPPTPAAGGGEPAGRVVGLVCPTCRHVCRGLEALRAHMAGCGAVAGPGGQHHRVPVGQVSPQVAAQPRRVYQQQQQQQQKQQVPTIKTRPVAVPGNRPPAPPGRPIPPPRPAPTTLKPNLRQIGQKLGTSVSISTVLTNSPKKVVGLARGKEEEVAVKEEPAEFPHIEATRQQHYQQEGEEEYQEEEELYQQEENYPEEMEEYQESLQYHLILSFLKRLSVPMFLLGMDVTRFYTRRSTQRPRKMIPIRQ